MRPPLHASTIAVALLLGAATACTGATAARTSPPAPAAEGRGAAASSPPASAAPVARRELSPNAKRLFDEAVATAEAQKRLKVPTDWEVLEQRWRAVADAQAIPEAFFNVGVARERRGRIAEAREAYRRAVEIDANFSPAVMNLALLDEPKDAREAMRYWSELLRRFPEEALPRERLAALYEAAGQLDEASTLAREALLRAPQSIGPYKVMMRVAVQRGRLDLAHLLAVKARKIEPADAEIEALVGDVLWREGEEAAAVAQWKKAVSLQGDFLPARQALLASALSRQQWEAVAEQAQGILRVTPSEARLHLILGIAHRHLGQPDKALAAYDQAERADPKLAEVHLARGVLLMKVKEQCEPAATELRRYVSDAGPAAASDGPAPRLLRECEAIVLAGRQAADAAREMKADAEREAARKGGAAAAPTPAGAESRDAKPSPTAAPAATSPVSPAGAPTAAGTTREERAAHGAGVPTR